MRNIQPVDFMIDAGQIYLKDVPVLVDVSAVAAFGYIYRTPSMTFLGLLEKKIFGDEYMGMGKENKRLSNS